MNIPHQTLIKRIELELGKAKASEKSQQIREHVYSIKALCEVLLENNDVSMTSPAYSQPQQSYFQESQPVQKPVTIQKEEPLETEDGANGQSLFDF